MVETYSPFIDVALALEEGLSKEPKTLPSWLFYDETGDKLFQEIMKLPEYYLTRCETEILQEHKHEFFKLFSLAGRPFNLIDLGAGDATKTEILLRYFISNHTQFEYSPVDVSNDVLTALTNRLQASIPSLGLSPVHAKYAEAIEYAWSDSERKIFMFLGANIGNLKLSEAQEFLQSIAEKMDGEDMLVVGFDLKKDPRLILQAYDDSSGITSLFNLNLLTRLNREVGANFNISQFKHFAFYNPVSGVVKSYLISICEQVVHFAKCDRSVHFRQWEPIHTEIAQKYDLHMIESLAGSAGLKITKLIKDKNQYFADVIMQRS